MKKSEICWFLLEKKSRYLELGSLPPLRCSVYLPFKDVLHTRTHKIFSLHTHFGRPFNFVCVFSPWEKHVEMSQQGGGKVAEMRIKRATQPQPPLLRLSVDNKNRNGHLSPPPPLPSTLSWLDFRSRSDAKGGRRRKEEELWCKSPGFLKPIDSSDSNLTVSNIDAKSLAS